MTPLHVCEQALQTPQSLNMQSTVGSHSVSAPQTTVSRASPASGFPQWSAIWATLRVRKLVPPSQDAEQTDHSAQSPQRPSWHGGNTHVCELQGWTSSLSIGWHILPPRCGIFAISRERRCWPPPHETGHALHSCHSPHSQSSLGQASVGQAVSSESSRLQPMPPGFLKCNTWRCRCRCAGPHETEQSDHSCQSLTWQSWKLHGFLLQPMVCTNSSGQLAPPLSGKTMICRCLCAWPPPQVLSQLSHDVHSDTTQSTCSFSTHDWVSSRSPSHARPLPSAKSTTFRSR
mmetsp:Transcript_129943/g.315660  ORF Transcript_129943/g.315660 Transcript_129943/m.315660 type:complete len:288 (-) Transcript_129943:2297-3160(-)